MAQLTIPGDLLTTIGLLLDIIGVFFLFLYAPEKFSDPQTGAFFALEDKEARPRWRAAQQRRKVVANISVAMIILGFVIQLIAVVFF